MSKQGSNIKIKNIKTYIEDNYQIAYSKARRELGTELIIMEKKEIKQGGFLGFFSKKKVKVTYGVESEEKPKEKTSNLTNDVKSHKDILNLIKSVGVEKNKQEEEKSSTGTYNPYKKNLEQTKNNRNFLKGIVNEEKKENLKKEESKTDFEEDFIEKLRSNDVDKETAKDILNYLKKNNYKEENYIKGAGEYFIKNFEVLDHSNEENFIMLVGPTGVGKTTSCAKMVANKWKEEKDVAFITADTYRLEAISQLKAYANIMRVPIEVVNNPYELKYAIEKFKNKDLVLMDTAGRSPQNTEQMEELKTYVDSVGAKISVSLVLTSTSKLSVLYDTIEKFRYIGFTSLIFTKLDETTNIGALLSVYRKYKIPVSYITTGQRVPDDIEIASKERLAEFFIEGIK